jgi:hypothetical protein
LIVKQVPFPALETQLNLLFPDGRQTSVILRPGQSLEAKLKEVESRLDAHDQTLRYLICNLLSGGRLPSILNDAVFKQCPDNALAIEADMSYRSDRATIVDE